MDVTAVGIGLTPAQQDETMTDLSFFLDRFGSTRAVRVKLQEQQREIGVLETQVRYLLMDRNRGLPSPQEEGNTTDSEKHSPDNREVLEESVDDTMADLDFFLRNFGSTRAVREKLENQEQKIVGLRRTVQWFQDRRGRDEGSDSDESSDVEYIGTEFSLTGRPLVVNREKDDGDDQMVIVLDDGDEDDNGGGDDPAGSHLDDGKEGVKRRESQPKDSNGEVAMETAPNGGGTKCRFGDFDDLAVSSSEIRDQEPVNRTSRVERKRRVCKEPGCTKRARYGGPKPGCCFPHGGGPRCTVPGCSKKRVLKGLCIAHGGYRECKIDRCCRRSYTLGLCRPHRRLRNL